MSANANANEVVGANEVGANEMGANTNTNEVMTNSLVATAVAADAKKKILNAAEKKLAKAIALEKKIADAAEKKATAAAKKASIAAKKASVAEKKAKKTKAKGAEVLNEVVANEVVSVANEVVSEVIVEEAVSGASKVEEGATAAAADDDEFVLDTNDKVNFVLIDGSYFVFYRYFALNVWWKNANSGDKPDISCNEDPAFIEKFKKTFESRIAEIDECLGLKYSIKFAAVDCKRSDIWRNHLYPAYKLTRTRDDHFGVSKFFKLTYEEKLFEAAGIDAMLQYEHLEADDCIAITTMHLRKTYPDAHIWIIANDHDYLQLKDENVHLYNLKYQDLTKSKSATGDPQQDLFCKIVAGDKSDNILSIFKKCGIKTAQKYYNDQDLFYKVLMTEPDAEELYYLNRTLVDFNYIPSDLVEGFRKECLLLPD